MNVVLGLLIVIVLTIVGGIVSPWIGGAVLLAGLVLLGVLALGASATVAGTSASDAGSRTPPEPVSLPGPGDPDSGVDATGARD